MGKNDISPPSDASTMTSSEHKMGIFDLMMSHILYIGVTLAVSCLFCVITPIVRRKFCRKRRRRHKLEEIGGGYDHSSSSSIDYSVSVTMCDETPLVNDNGKRKHKESDSYWSVVRYPGDDETFKQRMHGLTLGNDNNNKKMEESEDECNPHIRDDEFIVYDDINDIGPGFAMHMKENQKLLNLSDEEFIVESDERDTTRY